MNEAQRITKQSGKHRDVPAPARNDKARNTGAAAAPQVSASGAAERDEVFALVSVLYHALQAAETYSQYSADARRVSDEELVSFFEESKEQQNEIATRAKSLLVDRLDDSESTEDEDEDEDEDEESEG